MSQTIDRPPIPKSIRHKRILDVAADQPEASLDAIASEIPSATADLVERVLDQYGDPADEETESSPEPSESAMANEPNPPDPEELTPKQREILRLIAKHPDATQQELADLLDVTAPTISNRVNSIQGFDWKQRRVIVTTVLGDESISAEEEEVATDMDPTTSDQQAQDEQLPQRVSAIEDHLETLNETPESRSVFADPELAHKVLHACMQSEAITEEEELAIVKALLR